MATDFGDDVGDMILRWFQRSLERSRRYHNPAQPGHDYHRAQAIRDGKSAEEAESIATSLAARENTCIPFGSSSDAAYFAQVCRQNGAYVTPLADRDGNGFIQFAADDIDKIEQNIPRFNEVMVRLQADRITTRTEPVTREQLDALHEITELPSIPAQRFPLQEPDLASPNHTRAIAEKVKAAQEQSRSFEDFQARLAAKGIGISLTQDGENLFYEPRFTRDGTMLPYDHDKRDWAVGADTLKKNYGVDATHDWISQNLPPQSPDALMDKPLIQLAVERGYIQSDDVAVTDGSLDMRGETGDLNQGIESHDGRDTDTRTRRMEYEANASGDVPPSKERQERRQAYSLDSMARECRAASKQLETERGSHDFDHDLSNKMSPSR